MLKYFSLILFTVFSFSQEKIALQGSIFDTDNYQVPYAAVGIVKKHIGTSSTDEGTFYFVITQKEIEDTLQISCIGYKTFKIKVKDKSELDSLMSKTEYDKFVMENPS